MTNEIAFFALLAGMAVWYFIGAVTGYRYGIKKHQKQDHAKITKYLHEMLPNEWAAYQRGVHEGYDQGLRDGQDIFQ